MPIVFIAIIFVLITRFILGSKRIQNADKGKSLDEIAPTRIYSYPPQQKWISLGVTRETKITGEGLCLDDANRPPVVYIRGMTGSGKSRAIAYWVCQDMRRGGGSYGFALIDPTGSIYRIVLQVATRTAFKLENLSKGQSKVCTERILKARKEFLSRFILLDFSRDYEDYQADHGYRFNPLYVDRSRERVSEVVGDFLRTVERELGSLNETRRLKELLEGMCTLIAESGGTLLDILYFLRMDTEKYDNFIQVLEHKALREGWVIENDFHCKVIRDALVSCKPYSRERNELVASTRRALGVWLSDAYVRRFIDCKKGNIDFDDILNNGKYLLCHAPLGATAGLSRIIGGLIINKLQRQASRRTEEQKKRLFTIYGDEFHAYVDQDFATAAATIRQHGLSLFLAHQNATQPPFGTTDEGRGVLDTIMANSASKIFFRLCSAEDAEDCARYVHLSNPNAFKDPYLDITETETMSRSWQVTQSASHAISCSTSTGTTKNISLSNGISIGVTEGEGITKAHVHGIGLTVAKGKNFSQTTSRSSGITITEMDGDTYITSTSEGSGKSSSTSESQTVGRGSSQNTGHSSSYGTSYSPVPAFGMPTSGPDVHIPTSYPSASHSENNSYSNSEGSSTSSSETTGYSESVSSFVSSTEGYAKSKATSTGFNVGEGEAETIGNSESEALSKTISESIARLESISHSIARNMAEAASRGETSTVTHGTTDTESLSQGKGFTLGQGKSQRWVWERLSFAEQRELVAQRLQTLPDRQALIVLPTRRTYGDLEFGESGQLYVTEIKSHTIEDTWKTKLFGRDLLQELFTATQPSTVEPVGYANFERLLFDKKKNGSNPPIPEGFEE